MPAEHTCKPWIGQPGQQRASVRQLWLAVPSWLCARWQFGRLLLKLLLYCKLPRSRLLPRLHTNQTRHALSVPAVYNTKLTWTALYLYYVASAIHCAA